jgi:hypothetical protein
MQFRLRTLLILLTLGPVVLAGAWWAYQAFRPRSLVERMQDTLLEFEARERQRYEAGEPFLDVEETIIGYPFGPNDPRYPNGFPPNGQRPSQRSK